MGSMILYIPAKWMAYDDLVVAINSLNLLSQSFTPKHLRILKVCLPIRDKQLNRLGDTLPNSFEQLNIDLLQVPRGNEFIFFPSHGVGLSQLKGFKLPVIGYRTKGIVEQFNMDASMLIDPETEYPEKEFARTLQMLYFDPGAQRMMWKNLKHKSKMEEKSIFAPPLGGALNWSS